MMIADCYFSPYPGIHAETQSHTHSVCKNSTCGRVHSHTYTYIYTECAVGGRQLIIKLSIRLVSVFSFSWPKVSLCLSLALSASLQVTPPCDP